LVFILNPSGGGLDLCLEENRKTTNQKMTEHSGLKIHNASFRDPDASVFRGSDNKVYRQINNSYKEHFDLLLSSGLYKKLVEKKMLVSHQEKNEIIFDVASFYKTLFPEQIECISYPYEWSFSMLKDAALLTLEIMKESLSSGMILKDASPFNVQFVNGKPVFIDTSSFEKYIDGKPWIAYRQFCENFLGPLLLMRYRNMEMNKMLIIYPDGIPVKMISSLLPFKSVFNSGALMHIHFQSLVKSGKGNSKVENVLTLKRLLAIIDHLRSCIRNLTPGKSASEWENYYEEDILSNEYLRSKIDIVEEVISELNVTTALDMGSNTGVFSELLAKRNINVVSTDTDPVCIDDLYKKGNKNILPLVLDFTSPTPATGWANSERSSFWQRCNVDLILALALIHHLSIGKNISFKMLAEKLADSCKLLIIEFVPKSDPKVQMMLQSRKDIFSNYSKEKFEEEFVKHFMIEKQQQVSDSGRVIYLLRKK